MNYKTTFINASRIELVPHYKARNTILFARVNDSIWKAELKGKKTVEYRMEKMPSISEMQRQAK